MATEYECYALDENSVVLKKTGLVLFSSDKLHECCNWIYEYWKEQEKPVAVWQPRNNCFRDYYRADLVERA